MTMNDSKSVISVIIPVFNTEKYLNRCVDSLLEQTYQFTEIVLVDDGSTDSSGRICDEYAKKHENIVVIHKNNAGQGLARNDGMHAAKGDYICFLDSDDYYEKDTCEKLVGTMNQTGADICSYGYQIEDNYGNLIRRPNITDEEYVGKDGVNNFILHYFGDSMKDDRLRGVSSCMSVFKKSIITDKDISFPSERVVSSEDTAFCLEYCRYIDKAVTISDALYHYCQNESSFSRGYREDRVRLIKAHIELLNRYAKVYGNYDIVKDRIAMTTWINVIACYKQIYRHFNFIDSIKRYKLIAEDEVIKSSISLLPYRELPLKQKLLYEAVRMHGYAIAYLLVGVRTSKRL